MRATSEAESRTGADRSGGQSAERESAHEAVGHESSSTVDEGQALLQDLEAAFGAMVDAQESNSTAPGPAATASPSSRPPSSDTPAAVHELFSALAANHMRQVRDLVIGLHWNEPVADWHAICQPAITSLLAAAKQLENDELCASLQMFEAAIQHASPEGRNLTQPTRQTLIEAYKRLAKQLPDTFSLDAETSRRETVIVHSLLQQVPEVSRLVIDKLYAAGLSRLEFFVTATPEELVQTTGILLDVAARIIDKFREYRRVALKGSHDAVHSSDRARLAQLKTALRRLEEEFERAAEGWTTDAVARKRELRQLRTETFLEIKVVLARLGELTCLSELDKMSFRERIAYLDRFLRMTTPPQAPHS